MRHQRDLSMRAVALAIGLVLIATACGNEGDAAAETMRLEVIRGAVSLVHEGKSRTVTDAAEVVPGDSVVMVKDAKAELRLAEGRVLEMAGARVSIESPTSVKLTGGEVLGVLQDEMTIDTEPVVVTAERGAVRIDRAIATRIVNYGPGNVMVAGSAEELTVPRLRQTTVAGGIVPRAPKPIQMDPKDDWDQRFLQVAIDLDGRLTNFARGLEAQLGMGTGLDFFSSILPLGTDFGFLTPYLASRRSDLLLGLIVAGEANIPGADLGTRFSRVFDLWNQGATWGLIAFEFAVAQEGVFGKLLEAIQKAGLVSETGAGPGLTRRVQRPRNGRRSSGPSSTPSRPVSPTPSSPPPNPCSAEPKPPECIIASPTSILDDLFDDPDSGQGIGPGLPLSGGG